MSESYTTTLYQNVFKHVTKTMDPNQVMIDLHQDGLLLSESNSKRVVAHLQKLKCEVSSADEGITYYVLPGETYGVAAYEVEDVDGTFWAFYDHSAAPGVN